MMLIGFIIINLQQMLSSGDSDKFLIRSQYAECVFVLIKVLSTLAPSYTYFSCLDLL